MMEKILKLDSNDDSIYPGIKSNLTSDESISIHDDSKLNKTNDLNLTQLNKTGVGESL